MKFARESIARRCEESAISLHSPIRPVANVARAVGPPVAASTLESAAHKLAVIDGAAGKRVAASSMHQPLGPLAHVHITAVSQSTKPMSLLTALLEQLPFAVCSMAQAQRN